MSSNENPLDVSGVEMKMPEENFLDVAEPPARSWFWPILLIIIILILLSILAALLWFADPFKMFTPAPGSDTSSLNTATTSEPMASTTIDNMEEAPILNIPVFDSEDIISTSSATSTLDTATSTATTSDSQFEAEEATSTATTSSDVATTTASSTN